MKTKTIFAFALLLFFSGQLAAQVVSLDSTFSSDGIAITPFFTENSMVYSIAVQPDGKTVAAGRAVSGGDFHIALVRYNNDGTLDSTFSGDGMVITDFGFTNERAKEVVLDADGSIWIAGVVENGIVPEFFVAKYLANGSIDSSFSGDGFQMTSLGMSGGTLELTGMVLQSDGKILIGGYTDAPNSLLARMNPDGSPDFSFGAGGYLGGTGLLVLTELAVQPDGKIVVCGSNMGPFSDKIWLQRFNEDGSDDITFASGVLDTLAGSPGAASLRIQPDGKILIGGTIYNSSINRFLLVRYDTDGSVDSTFGTDGLVFTSVEGYESRISRITLQPDGKIVAAGATWRVDHYDCALARYLPDGSLDNTYSGDGVEGTLVTEYGNYPFDVEMTPDGKIVLAGFADDGAQYDFLLLRYLSGLAIGVDDFTNIPGHILVYPNPVPDQASLAFTLPEAGTVSIHLFKLAGEEVAMMAESKLFPADENKINLSFSESISAGMYLLVVSGPTGNATIRIVKE